MIKLGFLLSQYGDNELAKTFIKNANIFIESHMGIDVIGFVSNHEKPISNPSFATMNINEAFDYNGVLIATNLDMANKVINFPGAIKRVYYVWDLDWSGRSFEELIEIFHNPKLIIVSRNEKDKLIIKNCWNRCVDAVIPDFDMEAFAQMVKG